MTDLYSDYFYEDFTAEKEWSDEAAENDPEGYYEFLYLKQVEDRFEDYEASLEAEDAYPNDSIFGNNG